MLWILLVGMISFGVGKKWQLQRVEANWVPANMNSPAGSDDAVFAKHRQVDHR